MKGREAFELWAPSNIKWSAWVKPVTFVVINNSNRHYNLLSSELPAIKYIDRVAADTALIVDLAGAEAIKEAIALAKLGYRPVPLFNGTDSQAFSMALVDNSPIEAALLWGALQLEKITIPDTAPPAFLLDSNRSLHFKMSVNLFDNSWDLYYQDLPSATYFLNQGIDKIIVRADSFQKDLRRILYDFQKKKKIKIYYTNGFENPKLKRLRKPNDFLESFKLK